MRIAYLISARLKINPAKKKVSMKQESEGHRQICYGRSSREGREVRDRSGGS
jgi:hypothetical protein